MQMRAQQAGRQTGVANFGGLVFRQVVANSHGHPQDRRMPTEVVAPNASQALRWRHRGAGEQGEALRGGQGAGMFSET